jgi:hypothetical protein
MTLTVTIINQHGIWQSSDFRLTDPKTGKSVDEYSMKQMAFRCRDGAFLLTYAGAGSVHNIDFSDWIRQFSRGESRTVDETLIFIRERATADLGKILQKQKVRHMFSIGAFLMGVPWIVQIRNFNVAAERGVEPVDAEFHTIAQKIPENSGAVVPWPPYVNNDDLILLRAISGKRPRKPEEFSNLLAEVNRRTSNSVATQGSVSPHCVTTYLPPSGDGMKTRDHNMPEGAPISAHPIMLFGIDLTEMMKSMLQGDIGQTVPGQSMVTPENPLDRKSSRKTTTKAAQITSSDPDGEDLF